VGPEDRRPTREEMEIMKDALEEAMNQGAFGLSSGLIYAPGRYATTDEIAELASVATRRGGI
ncbi:MAG: D-aminoacylase, partial [Gemmatimonadota bacterium]